MGRRFQTEKLSPILRCQAAACEHATESDDRGGTSCHSADETPRGIGVEAQSLHVESKQALKELERALSDCQACAQVGLPVSSDQCCAGREPA